MSYSPTLRVDEHLRHNLGIIKGAAEALAENMAAVLEGLESGGHPFGPGNPGECLAQLHDIRRRITSANVRMRHTLGRTASLGQLEPMYRHEFFVAVPKLAMGLRNRLPRRVWEIFDDTLRGGELRMTVEDLLYQIELHNVPVTAVEHRTLRRMLDYLDFDPAVLSRITVVDAVGPRRAPRSL